MCIQDVSQIISSIATTVAAIVAIWGVNTWKRKKDMEFTEEVLTLFYQAERAIEDIRNPLYDLAKGQSREPEKNETPEQKQARDRAYVVFKKIMEHGEIFDELHTMRFRFMARFGKEKAKPFDDLKRIVDQIWVSAQELAELWEKQFSQVNLSSADQNLKKEYESVIWQGWATDTINPRVDKIIQDIEKVCRPIIEVKYSRWISGLTGGLLEHIKKRKT
jgi:hypothetical protein